MSAAPAVPADTDSSATTSTRITDPRLLLLARTMVVLYTVASIVSVVVTLPGMFSVQICDSPDEQCPVLATIPRETADQFARAGVDYHIYTTYRAAINIVFDLITMLLCLLLLWRRSDDGMALLIVAAFATFFSQLPIPIGPALAGAFLILFPTGRFQPRWTLPLYIVFAVVYTVQSWIVDSAPILAIPGTLLLLALLGAAAYRYRRIFSPLQRQQAKWVFLSFFVTVGWFLFDAILLLPLVDAAQSDPLHVAYKFLLETVSISVVLSIVVALWFAIWRYRLWDIDFVINRSLVYGAVAVLLALLFAGIIGVVSAVTHGQGSGIAAVVAAVIATALFNPARKAAQHLVDHYIYRLRFDLNELNAAQKASEIQNPGALSGRKLGAYDVLDVIGRGGMGEVYKGHSNGKIVALKILPRDLAQQDEFRRRFEREAQALTALIHPHIVKMYGAGTSDGIAYMAMEYIEGRDLGDRIKADGALALDEACDVLTGLADALDYAHGQGLVHRDIKPSNVMLRRSADGETWEGVLMDFGVAKVHDARTGITGTGAIGTIDYMAPEQITSARDVDQQADIYALGVVLYEMLTGERPFKGGPAQVMFAHLQQPAPDPRDLKPDIPRGVARAVLKALEKKPEDRFPSAGELAAALI